MARGMGARLGAAAWLAALLTTAPVRAEDAGSSAAGGVALGLVALLLIFGLAAALFISRKRMAELDAKLGATSGEANRLRELLDLVPHPVWWHGPDRDIAYHNRCFGALL